MKPIFNEFTTFIKDESGGVESRFLKVGIFVLALILSSNVVNASDILYTDRISFEKLGDYAFKITNKHFHTEV